MTWRRRRQILYIGVAVLIAGAGLTYAGYQYFSTPGTCFDRVQNDGEAGVDCGGPCARMCAFQSHDPIVEWARALEVATGTYDGVVYLENPQSGVGGAAYGVGYEFRFLDANNHLIIDQSGTIDIPAEGTVPVVIPDIETGNQVVSYAQFSFTTSPIVWTKLPPSDIPSLAVKDQTLAPDGTRLSASIVNETNGQVNNLTVVGVLFDANANALAASRSVISSIGPEGKDEAVFTWPQPTLGFVRAEITPLPALPPNPQP